MLNSHNKLSSDPNCNLNRSSTKNILQALIQSLLCFLDISMQELVQESLDWCARSYSSFLIYYLKLNSLWDCTAFLKSYSSSKRGVHASFPYCFSFLYLISVTSFYIADEVPKRLEQNILFVWNCLALSLGIFFLNQLNLLIRCLR